jgi:UDP-N-acetylmuramoyl-tripeptide--D-alanyl-D-alanine ligase
MILIKWLYAVVILCVLPVPSGHALHMFQQNRYECGRYSAWIRENLPAGTRRNYPVLGILLLSLLGCFVQKDNLALACSFAAAGACAWILFERERRTTYVKPLVYTRRVWVQVIVLCLLNLCWLIPLGMNFSAWARWGMLAMGLFSPWILIYPMALITAPIEKAVSNHYLNDAKRILASRPDLKIIGITGSYGKTSTKNIMQAVLSEQYNSLMTPASYNTPMGITRTIREMLKPIHEVFICEMGADHVGDITYLMDFVHPSIGIVTSVGPQHLNTFGCQENILKEKMQMIEKLPADGLGILNLDNDLIRSYPVRNKVKTVTYGIQCKEAEYRAEDISYSPEGSTFTLVHGDEKIAMSTRLLGEHNILNILCAAAAARSLGVEWPVIQKAVRGMHYVEHRLELKKISGYTFIDDAFNSNPVGAAMSLNVMKMMPGKRVIVTPGMIDLGEKQEPVNHDFGAKMKGNVDDVILVGEHQTKPIYEGLQSSGFDMAHVRVVKTEREAFAFVYSNFTPEDTILLENDLPDAFNS